jgi:LysM repeat protein
MHQAEYCYSTRFASCSVFLAWAARNAAEPTYVREAAQRAWGAGVAMPESGTAPGAEGVVGSGAPAFVWGGDRVADVPGDADGWSGPTPEDGLFGPADPTEASPSRPASELLDWVSASAWAEAPWDPDAEEEPEELEAATVDEVELEEFDLGVSGSSEALQGPRIPAALPMRRRRPPSEPIRARGSGEWLYADPPKRSPLVTRRTDIGSPILLAVLGLLVVALIVFLLPTLLGGRGGDDRRTAAGASPSSAAPVLVLPTRPPAATLEPSARPSPTPEPEIRTYTVKPGDTLSGIASNPRVRVPLRLLQCINGLTNPNLIQPGQELLIPPDGYACPAGWRRGGTGATPAPQEPPIDEAGPVPSPEA